MTERFKLRAEISLPARQRLRDERLAELEGLSVSVVENEGKILITIEPVEVSRELPDRLNRIFEALKEDVLNAEKKGKGRQVEAEEVV